MRYFLLIDQATNEGVYILQQEVPIYDNNTRLFESFDNGQTYIELPK